MAECQVVGRSFRFTIDIYAQSKLSPRTFDLITIRGTRQYKKKQKTKIFPYVVATYIGIYMHIIYIIMYVKTRSLAGPVYIIYIIIYDGMYVYIICYLLKNRGSFINVHNTYTMQF